MPPRPKKPSAKASNKLLEAINFLACITSEEGTPYETHILLSNKTAIAYNDVLTAGILIEEDIFAAPYNATFKQALSKCEENYTLVIDGKKIVLKSGKFKANIPCIDPNLLSSRFPDAPVAQIDDRLKAALACIDVIKIENGQRVELLSFLLNGQSVISTDGKILIEYWHGIDLPTLTIPRILIPVITNNSKKLASFGFSQTSVTFYFEDNSWVKSQLYSAEYPLETVQTILGKSSNPSAIPPDFFKALDAVAGFSNTGTVYFHRDKLCSHKIEEAGATHEVIGLPNGPVYSFKYLAMLKGLAEKVDFGVSANGSVHSENTSGHLLFFFGKNVRGVVAGHG